MTTQWPAATASLASSTVRFTLAAVHICLKKRRFAAYASRMVKAFSCKEGPSIQPNRHGLKQTFCQQVSDQSEDACDPARILQFDFNIISGAAQKLQTSCEFSMFEPLDVRGQIAR